MSRIVDPDALALDTLVRLQLTARQLGATIELRNACTRLVDLIALAGLADVLVVVGRDRLESGVEVQRQVEEREQRGVDEEILRGDGTV